MKRIHGYVNLQNIIGTKRFRTQTEPNLFCHVLVEKIEEQKKEKGRREKNLKSEESFEKDRIEKESKSISS